MTKSPLSDEFVHSLEGLKTIGRYEVKEKIGQGAAGIVYKGWDPYIKRFVAIKISQPTSGRARERFFVEAQSAGRLNHPNMVAIYDIGVQENFFYITMEYIEGSPLDKFCHKDNLLPLKKAVECMFSACNALDNAHKNGIIHRDIKPANIMLTTDETTKIADFGIAQMAGETSEMGVWGTPSYMAPEQLKEEAVGSFNDIFSLGCVMYELLTGLQAFPGDNYFTIMYKITNEEPAKIRSVRPELPEILEDIVHKAISKDHHERYQSCVDFAYELRVAIRGLSGHTKAEKIKDAFDYVNNVSFFKSFSREQIQELGSASEIIKVKSGKVIVAEGEIDDTFYIILSGTANICKGNTAIADIGVGACFGEMAYIRCQARTATVMAASDCILIKISATLLDKASESIQLLFFKNFALTLVDRLSDRDQNNS